MDVQRLAMRMLRRVAESEHFLILNKPAGLPVHSPQKRASGGVMQAVRVLYGGGRDWQVCYRLDKYTSGVLVIAKSQVAAERFQDRSNQGGVQRRFVAVVRGVPKTAKAAEKGTEAAKVGGIAVLEGAQVSVLKKFERFSLVSVKVDGVVKVRVRELLKSMRSPVLADPRFDPRASGRQMGRLFLHLERVSFRNPFTEETEAFDSSVPKGFEEAAQGRRVVDDHLETALAARLACLMDEETDAFRLFGGRGDGISGLVADRFGPLVMLQARQGKFDGGMGVLRTAAHWYERRLGATTVYARNTPRDRSQETKSRGGSPRHQDLALETCTALCGDDSVRDLTVCEHGIRYIVRPKERFSVGLFLDQRENRRRLMELAEGKRVLNLFAYTCAFSVAAAKGGAEMTSSVDISKKALEWGKMNFEANHLSLDAHRFYCSDTFSFFKRAIRQEHKYDIIVHDPPTFARTKKPATVFQVQKDMVRLIRESLPLLARRGAMLISTNHRELSEGWIREQVEKAGGQRHFSLMKPLSPQPDFTGSSDASKSIWVRF